MNTGEARIIAKGDMGARVCAAAARLSTTEGGALDALARGDGGEKDARLILKVLSSGHKTVAEHQQFSIALQDVSVLAEQALIEHRLASYTVKSRRYVDFSGAGYVIPKGLTPGERAEYARNMDARFVQYQALIGLGIPREDARFVLPYCFKSNILVTVNARELAHMAFAFTKGRLSRYEELRELGGRLIKQAEQVFPGIKYMDAGERANNAAQAAPRRIIEPGEAAKSVELIAQTANARGALDAIMGVTNRFAGEGAYGALARDARPRELEALQYSFLIRGVSLACVTHFARHRIQSFIAPSIEFALAGGARVMPDTVRGNPEALKIYVSAFEDNARAAEAMRTGGLAWENLAYYALSGNAMDILVTMNARELMHFFKLRTCARAQWEIRDAANEMLSLLMEDFGALFRYYGPSCAVDGRCPEGRLSCGRARKLEE